jgi:hypothetical protein
MSSAYSGCYNITGSPVCGPNVTDVSYAYDYCSNFKPNVYFYSNNITSVTNCFGAWGSRNMLNIYVPQNSITLNTCLNENRYKSITGSNCRWISDGNYYYDTNSRFRIYPVADVEAARTANGD